MGLASWNLRPNSCRCSRGMAVSWEAQSASEMGKPEGPLRPNAFSCLAFANWVGIEFA
jgi:hypothetical protein